MDTMEDRNPYAPPKARVADIVAATDPDRLTAQVASGQKRMIWAILLQLGGILLGVLNGLVSISPVLAVVTFISGVAAFGLSISGFMQTARGLKIRPAVRGLLVVCLFLPILNLVLLLILNSRATRALRAAGYHVGMFGVTSKYPRAAA